MERCLGGGGENLNFKIMVNVGGSAAFPPVACGTPSRDVTRRLASTFNSSACIAPWEIKSLSLRCCRWRRVGNYECVVSALSE